MNGHEPLDRVGGGLGVRRAALHLREAAVRVLSPAEVPDRRAGGAAAGMSRGRQRLQRRPGHVEVGAGPRGEAEAATRLLRPLEPGDGARVHRPAGGSEREDPEGRVADVAGYRAVGAAAGEDLAYEVPAL